MSDIEVWRPNQFKLVNELRLPPEKETNAKKMKTAYHKETDRAYLFIDPTWVVDEKRVLRVG